MNTYGKLRESCQAIAKSSPGPDWIQTFENQQRPTPDHVLSTDGVWYLPELNQLTKGDIQEKRKARYQAETDGLLTDIMASGLQGEDTTVKELEWTARVKAIKEELPYPNNENVVKSHYEPLLPPTEKG